MFSLISLTIAITIIPAMAQFPGEAALAKLPVWPVDGKCTPGHLYRRKCHICYCLNYGTAVCSVVGCDPDDKRETTDVERLPEWPTDGLNCIPGQSYRKDCNTCTCYRDGFGVCSEVNCNLRVNRAGLIIASTSTLGFDELPLDDVCAPKTYWKRCEQCSCKFGKDPICHTVGCENEVGYTYLENPYK